MGNRYTKVENRYHTPLKIILTHPCGRNTRFHLGTNGSRVIKSQRRNVTVSVFDTDEAEMPYSALTVAAGTHVWIESDCLGKPGVLCGAEQSSVGSRMTSTSLNVCDLQKSMITDTPGIKSTMRDTKSDSVICRQNMQLKIEVKECLGNTLKSAVSGLRDEAEKGTKEMATTFAKFLKDIENKTIELRNDLDRQIAIGPQADTFYRLIEKQTLAFKAIIAKCTLKVTAGKVCDFNAVDIKQQELVLLELERYLRNGVKILTKVLKALQWSFRCIALVLLSVFIYRIYKSDNPLKEATEKIISTGVGAVSAVTGSKIGALIGAIGGPIGVVVGSILGGMIGGIIGGYCGKGIFKIVCMLFFPKYTGGPGQPPIKETKYIYCHPCIHKAETIMEQTKLHGLIPEGLPKVTGAEAAIGVPKLW